MIAAPAVHAIAPRCTGAQVSGRFAVIPGSAGAGNIVYRLRLTNVSPETCTLTGLPQVTLRAKDKRRLPTHVRAARPGALTAVLVTLRHGRSAYATARFSPDVPGPGETGRQCEPKAYWLRVLGRDVPVAPPTPVCEHGQLQLTAYSTR